MSEVPPRVWLIIGAVASVNLLPAGVVLWSELDWKLREWARRRRRLGRGGMIR